MADVRGGGSDPLAGLPDDLAALLRDQSVIVPQDAAVFELIAKKWMDAPSDTAAAMSVAEWQQAWSVTCRRMLDAQARAEALRVERDTAVDALRIADGMAAWLRAAIVQTEQHGDRRGLIDRTIIDQGKAWLAQWEQAGRKAVADGADLVTGAAVGGPTA